MGGIATDLRGRTSIKGLWAVGEVASTGLHGANRLASNSLLEAAVFGARVATDIKANIPTGRAGHFVEPRRVAGARPADPEERAMAVAKLRTIMMTYVGVVRTAKGLRRALDQLSKLEAAGARDSVLANMLLAARLITAAALMRKESRGGHFRTDFPEADPKLAERTFMTLYDLAAIQRKKPPRAAALQLAGCGT